MLSVDLHNKLCMIKHVAIINGYKSLLVDKLVYASMGYSDNILSCQND